MELNTPDLDGNILELNKQKIIADLWRRLGSKNQGILCAMLDLNLPQTLPAKNKSIQDMITAYLASINVKLISYVPNALSNSHSLFQNWSTHEKVSHLTEDVKVRTLQFLFKDALIEQNYSWLSISKEEPKKLNITPDGLFSILIERLQQSFKPASFITTSSILSAPKPR